MKFFLDTADVVAIRKAKEMGMCDGVTTNPSLIMKSGRDHKEVIQEISGIVEGPISVEAISEDAEGMVREAEEFSGWGRNIVIKVPMTKEGLKAVRILKDKGIRTNVTLVFSPSQALLAAKAGAAYVSPFVGRLDDISQDGMFLVAEILDIFDNYDFDTEVIVASIRHPGHVVEAARLGAHIATVPAAVLEKLYNHPLTDRGIEKFLADYEKSKK
ncbi:fructose-6-phosphate aldolase [Candidatus Micrarchaeota archaeon]|nr:fructose-6-phosphate aldolase [Candidatus Micrarchaeota archaeon]